MKKLWHNIYRNGFFIFVIPIDILCCWKSQFRLNHELQDLLNNVFRIFTYCLCLLDDKRHGTYFHYTLHRWRRRHAGLAGSAAFCIYDLPNVNYRFEKERDRETTMRKLRRKFRIKLWGEEIAPFLKDNNMCVNMKWYLFMEVTAYLVTFFSDCCDWYAMRAELGRKSIFTLIWSALNLRTWLSSFFFLLNLISFIN